MSEPNHPEVLAYLQEHGPSTMRELVKAFAEKTDDPRELQHHIRSQLIRLQRQKLVSSVREPLGTGKIWSAVPEDVAAS